jgi:hypothetical protein
VTKVSYRVPAWRGEGGQLIIMLVTIALSEHGEPVSVDRPTNVVD